MSRVRKWRIWMTDSDAETDNVMGYFDPMHEAHQVSDEASAIAATWFFETLNDPECVIMDFTGLQDADGRDIYEGDIIALHESDFPDAHMGLVEWDASAGAFVVVDGDESWSLAELHMNRSRIFGDRYRNPKLLEIPND